jgi:hypothetical protein
MNAHSDALSVTLVAAEEELRDRSLIDLCAMKDI